MLYLAEKATPTITISMIINHVAICVKYEGATLPFVMEVEVSGICRPEHHNISVMQGKDQSLLMEAKITSQKLAQHQKEAELIISVIPVA